MHQETSCGGGMTQIDYGEKIGFRDLKKVKVMIMIMNFFGHDHDHYEKM